MEDIYEGIDKEKHESLVDYIDETIKIHEELDGEFNEGYIEGLKHIKEMIKIAYGMK